MLSRRQITPLKIPHRRTWVPQIHKKCPPRAPKAPDIICRCCHISSAPCWASVLQHKLQISVRHATDPTYLQFLNIIRDREPTESEIEATLSTCFVNELELTGHIHADTTILCSHRQDVMMYNDIVFKKNLVSRKQCV
jgi:hypothetical protein